MTCNNGTIMLRKANWDKTLQNSLKFSYCRKRIRKQIRPSCRKKPFDLILCLFGFVVSWKQRNLEIRANIHKSCRRPVVSLLYATKSVFTAPIMLGMCTCLPCHIPDRWSRNANQIWPDLAFGFVHKRSGNEIKLWHKVSWVFSPRFLSHCCRRRGCLKVWTQDWRIEQPGSSQAQWSKFAICRRNDCYRVFSFFLVSHVFSIL